MSNPEGRPTKLTPELKDRIVTVLRAGNYIETAAAFAGVSKQTLYTWMKQGARANSQDNTAEVQAELQPYVEFLDAVEKAQAESEIRDLQTIAAASVDNWQAAAWRLERRNPKRWGRQDKVELSGEVDSVVKVKHLNVPPAFKKNGEK